MTQFARYNLHTKQTIIKIVHISAFTPSLLLLGLCTHAKNNKSTRVAVGLRHFFNPQIRINVKSVWRNSAVHADRWIDQTLHCAVIYGENLNCLTSWASRLKFKKYSSEDIQVDDTESLVMFLMMMMMTTWLVDWCNNVCTITLQLDVLIQYIWTRWGVKKLNVCVTKTVRSTLLLVMWYWCWTES